MAYIADAFTIEDTGSMNIIPRVFEYHQNL